MRSITFFLLGNFFLVLISILHLIGYFLGSPDPATETEKQLFYLMNNLEIDMMGIMRSFMDIIKGYSLMFAASTFFMAIYNLAFIKFIKENPALYRNILLINISLWGIELVIFSYYLVLPIIILSGIALLIFLLAYFFSLPFNMKSNR